MIVMMISLVQNVHNSGQYTSQTLHPNVTTSYYKAGLCEIRIVDIQCTVDKKFPDELMIPLRF